MYKYSNTPRKTAQIPDFPPNQAFPRRNAAHGFTTYKIVLPLAR